MYSGTAADSFAIFFARLAVCLSVLFSIPVYMYAVRGAVWRSIFTDDEEMDQTKFDSQRYLGIRMGEIKHHVFNILFLILVFMLVSVFADSLRGRG